MKNGRMEKSGPNNDSGNFFAWFRDFAYQLLISWQLLWDRRIPASTKLLPLLVLAYILSPVDILPDTILGPGQLDDLAVFLLGLKLFVSLAPPAIVEEYRRQLSHVTPPSAESAESSDEKPDVIDLEARSPSRSSPDSDKALSPGRERPSEETSPKGTASEADVPSDDETSG